MDMLLKHAWPGNVRELENALERAVILLTGEHITEKQLPLGIVQQYAEIQEPPQVPASALVGSRSLGDIEKEAILATLEAAGQNKSEAARRLGITRKTLHNKLKSYDLE
jgi:two-component system response regulator HydG